MLEYKISSLSLYRNLWCKGVVVLCGDGGGRTSDALLPAEMWGVVSGPGEWASSFGSPVHLTSMVYRNMY